MTTINTTTTQENVSNVRLFIVCALLMLSSTVSFAQSKTTSVESFISTQVSVSKAATTTITTDEVIAATSMDFAVWFMGSKKTSNNTTNGTFSKKQLINSGINTTSVLIRSFLKKVSNQENGVA